MVETKQAKDALKLVKKLSANMTLEQLDAMSLKKEDAKFREAELERCAMNVARLKMKFNNVTHAVKLQKQLSVIATQSLQRALHRANQANKNARNAPHIETATIAVQLERAQNATKRARVFYIELKKRTALTKQAEKAMAAMKERVEDQKAQCAGFGKNLKQKKTEEVDGGVDAMPAPEEIKKDPKKLPPWFQPFLKKNGWKGPNEKKVNSQKNGGTNIAFVGKDGKKKILTDAKLTVSLHIKPVQGSKQEAAATGASSAATVATMGMKMVIVRLEALRLEVQQVVTIIMMKMVMMMKINLMKKKQKKIPHHLVHLMIIIGILQLVALQVVQPVVANVEKKLQQVAQLDPVQVVQLAAVLAVQLVMIVIVIVK